MEYDFNDPDYNIKLFQKSPIGICFCERDGTFKKVNAAFCQIVGYTDAELMNKTFKDITHPEDLAFDVAMVEKLLLKEMDHYEMNKRYIHKMGGAVWVKLSVDALWNDDGTFKSFVGYTSQLLNGERLKAEYQSKNKIMVRPTIKLSEFWKDNWKTLVPIAIMVLGGLGGTYFAVLDTNYEQTRDISIITTTVEGMIEDNKEFKKETKETLKAILDSINKNEQGS